MTVIARRYHLRQGLTEHLHLAWDERTNQEVFARHVWLPPELDSAGRRTLAEQILTAAHDAKRPRHPAINIVLDAVSHGPADASTGPLTDPFTGPWIISTAVVGRPLNQVVAAEGPLAPHRVAALGLDLAAALAAGHALGIPHRDVRPENVWVTPDGHGVLTGFGAGLPAHTSNASSVGTPGFTAPEGLDQPGPAADGFSLAATLYFAVEGLPPFPGDDPMAVLSAVLAGSPRPPQRAGDLGPVLLARLAKDPADRPVALADDLEPLAETPRPTKRRVTPRPLSTAAIAVGLTIVTASLAVIATYALAPDTTSTQTNHTVTGNESASAEPGRFTAVPRACDLLTYAQTDQLIPKSAHRNGEQRPTGATPSSLQRTTCDIYSAGLIDRRSIKITAVLFTDGPFGSGPATARHFVLGTKEDVQDQATRRSEIPREAIQDLPGIGDQAFTYDEKILGTQSTVVFNVNNVAATVECQDNSRGKTVDPALLHTCSSRAGRWISESLTKAK